MSRRRPAAAHAQPPRSGPPGLARLGWGLALVAAAVMTAYLGRGLLATLYESHALERRRLLADSTVALSASELAARLAPWRAGVHRSRAQSLVLRRQPEAARAQFALALQRAPGDAALWRDYARALPRMGEFGAPLLAAMQRALTLAPRSRTTRFGFAVDALYYWNHGTAPVQALWLESLRLTLAVEARRFLRYTGMARRERLLCAYHGTTLQLQQWCEQTAGMRIACDSDTLDPAVRGFCDSIGLFRPERP